MTITQARSGGGSWRVFLIDAHSILRDGLRRLLERERGYHVCGEAESGRTAASLIAQTRPDLVIMEIGAPDAKGLKIIKRLRVRFPRLRVLVLSMYNKTLYAERALKAGAKGYVMKHESWERLRVAIRQVLGGEIGVSEPISSRLMSRSVSRRNGSSRHLRSLSDRELEIVDGIGQGMATREIARCLGISAKTVEAHRGNIRRKLGLHSGPELMRFALASRTGG